MPARTSDRIVANGESRLEQIRGEPSATGTRSDPVGQRIALHLFEDRGPRALHLRRVRVRDQGRARPAPFAARDRLASPLYYTIHDGTFYLASEVKALAALGVPLR